MKRALRDWAVRLAMEPPFRILVRAALRRLPASVHTRAQWELAKRPVYLLGVLTAAQQATRQGINAISVVEFGVAGGEGLIALQEEAAAVEAETGIEIKVYGFDMGPQGLPQFIGDYRDHPDEWRPGDFSMDESRLRSRLDSRTTLIVGNVNETVNRFFHFYAPPPLGFIAFDLDLYSSTRDALRIFALPGKKMLFHVPLYFDDVDCFFNSKFAGELLAIDEFNAANGTVKIDRWRGVRNARPFPERPFLDKLFVAHDLDAISRATVNRAPAMLPLRS